MKQKILLFVIGVSQLNFNLSLNPHEELAQSLGLMDFKKSCEAVWFKVRCSLWGLAKLERALGNLCLIFMFMNLAMLKWLLL